ncbi:DUF6531 domain-containing protein [uncultured Tateyamaria sp.]|uniref:DUF6531 domain-containing protein n=1 Tax=Tateyamaria sp. 1078 TaxID=3417464 RepID=UPI002638FC73|nr:DUF6531 domain-containing protein [uncultured Tateyamaria sp.]
MVVNPAKLMVVLVVFISTASMVLAQSCPSRGTEMWRKTGLLIGLDPDDFVGSAGAACNDKNRNIARHVSTETIVRASGEGADCNYTYRLFGQQETGVIEGAATLYCVGYDENGDFKVATGFCKPQPDCLCPDGSCCAGAGGPPPGAAGPPPPNPGTSSAGNPVAMSNGSKSEAVADWVSSKDPRFHFARYYSSHDHEPRLAPILKHGVGWSSNWEYSMGRTQTSGVEEYVRAPGDRRIGFFVSFNTAALSRDGQQTLKSFKSTDTHTLTIFEEGRSEGVILGDGTGRQIELRTDADGTDTVRPVLFASRMSWPDGYAITFDHDAFGRISAIEDNRNQRAEFEWAVDAGEDRARDRVARVLVDTDYTSGPLLPEVEIQYVYTDVDPTVFPAVLDGVEATDLATGQVLSRWQYSYRGAENLVDESQLEEGASAAAASGTVAYPREALMGAARTVSPKLLATFDGLNADRSDAEAFGRFSYDTGGRALTTERNGGTSRFAFQRDTNITTVTNPLGKQTSYIYEFVDLESNAIGATGIRVKLPTRVDGAATASCLATVKELDYTPNTGAPAGYVYTRTERNGARTLMERDGRGLILTKTEDADGISPRVTTYTWHPDLRLPLTRTTTQMSESFAYDADGLLIRYTQTDALVGSPSNGQSRTWDYGYTTLASGLKVMTSVDGPGLAADGINDVTSYAYNADGTLALITDANGLVTQYAAYDSYGNVTRIIQPDGVVAEMAYDAEGQVTQYIENAGQSAANTTAFTYDLVGQLVSYTTASGEVWTMTYDLARRMTSMENSTGERVNFTYDAASNLTSTEYLRSNGSRAFTEATAYDELSRIRELLGARGQNTVFSYDEEDNLTSIVDAMQFTTSQGYDALNRLTQVIDRAAGLTEMEHDDADQVTQFTDPRQITTQMVHNGFGDVISEVSADRGTMAYTYDSRGLVTSSTDGNGVLSTYSYDDGGRITARRFPSDPGQDQTFRYDYTNNNSQGEGKIDRIDDANGFTHRRYRDGGYVSLDRRKIENIVYSTTCKTDGRGRLARILTPGKLELRYSYDGQDRVTKITAQRKLRDPITNQFPQRQDVIKGIKYNPFGPVQVIRYNDGYSHNRVYDQSYRLTRLRDRLGDDVLRNVTYSWTERDNLAVVSDQLNALNSETYQYTPCEFLAEAVGNYGELDFTYDGVGNRSGRSLYENASVVEDIYAYPLTSNRLESIALGQGGTRSLTYDAAGNVT